MTLYFNSPSRRFYLSLIALVVNEMKRSGKNKTILLQDHLEILKFLNESVGEAAGSSERESLLPRIYTKWKNALPNLEEAPLFRVLGKKKEAGDGGVGKIYSFSDEEKDGWANLFDYMGSEENVRLKFATDKAGISLDETAIIFQDSTNGEAWDRFISSLKKHKGESPGPAEDPGEETAASEPPAVPLSPPQEQKISRLIPYRWVLLIVAIGVVAALIGSHFLSPAPVEVASLDRMKDPPPDKPTIAVLPFVNMTEDPKQEFFSDGMTEEVITALSKVPNLIVIARNSTFTYKGKAVKVKQVSEELNVRYVLEGSVRKTNGKVRITAQLIDALSGHHLWAERYDRDLKDIFALQDEITLRIVAALQVKLVAGEMAHLMAKGTKNVDAYIKLLQGIHLMTTKEGNTQARKVLEEAMNLDPKYSRVYTALAFTHLNDMWYGTTGSPEESLTRAFDLAQKAVSLDDSNAAAHGALGWVCGMRREYDRAIAECERGVALYPSSAENFEWLGTVLTWAGRAEEAVKYLQHAIRLNPLPAASTMNFLALAYRESGQYEKAIEASRKALQREPGYPFPYIHMTISYIRLGREEEARTAAADLLRVNPKFSLDRYAKNLPFPRPMADRIGEDLRKAGLK